MGERAAKPAVRIGRQPGIRPGDDDYTASMRRAEALALLDRNICHLLGKWSPEKVGRRMDLSLQYVLEVAAAHGITTEGLKPSGGAGS